MPMPQGDPWKPIELKLPHDMVRAIDIVARRRGVSRSECIRQCIAWTLATEGMLDRMPPEDRERWIEMRPVFRRVS